MIGSAEARRAGLYRELTALEHAGIPLRTALDKILDPSVATVRTALDEGLDTSEAFARAREFSNLEVALISAGAKGGQLVQSFASLEALFMERCQSRRALAMGLAYPVFLIHLAVLLPNARILVTDGVAPYLKVTVVPLLIAWATLGAIGFLVPVVRNSVPGLVDGIIASIPFVGALVRKTSLVHGIQAFLALYRAGVPVDVAVNGARDAASFAPTSAAFERVRRRIDGGETLGDAFLKEEGFPPHLRQAASTGALTGKLEDTLGGAQKLIQHEADSTRRMILGAAPVIAFLCVAAYVAFSILSFWGGYFNQINEAMR